MTNFDTPRLLLRPMRMDDLPAKHEIDQQPAVYQFGGFERLPGGETRESTLEEPCGNRARKAGLTRYRTGPQSCSCPFGVA
jgi:hypothetical protein